MKKLIFCLPLILAACTKPETPKPLEPGTLYEQGNWSIRTRNEPSEDGKQPLWAVEKLSGASVHYPILVDMRDTSLSYTTVNEKRAVDKAQALLSGWRMSNRKPY